MGEFWDVLAGVLLKAATFLLLICMFLSIPISLVTLLLFFVIRNGVWLLAKVFRPDLISMVSGTDNVVLFEDQEHSPINAVGATIVDGQLTPERIRQLIQERIFTLRNAKSELVYWKSKMYFTNFLGYPFWKEDPEFHLNFHVRQYDYEQPELQLPEICRQKDVEKLFGGFVRMTWPKTRSPWEILVHQKYVRDEEDAGEFKTVCIGRTCHVLGDGYSGAELARIYTGSNFTLPDFKLNERLRLSRKEKIWMGLKMPLDVAMDTYEGLRCRKFRHFSPPPENKRELVFSMSSLISVGVIKRIKNRYGVGFNSVLTSVIMGAIQRGIEKGGVPVPKNLGGFFILPLPNHPGGMVNHATLAVARFPCVDDPARARLKKIHEKIVKQSRRITPLVGFKVIPAVQYFPTAWKTWAMSICGNWFYSFGVSNLPVTTSADYVDGMEILDGFGALSGFRSWDFVIGIGGCNNRLRFNFCVEKSYFASEDIIHSLGRFVEEEIKELSLGL